MAGRKKAETKAQIDKTELVISTEALKAMVTKAYKGVGNNKLLPLTQLMCIEAKDGKLTLIVSDASETNYFFVKYTGEDAINDFYATVMADQFVRLISKLTCSSVKLSIDDNKLKVIGNGNYTIALQYDEMGNAIKYPNPIEELGKAEGKAQTISSATIAKILNVLKPSLADTMEVPYLTNYYVGDMVASTNSDEAGIINSKVLKNPVLLPSIVVDFLGLSEAKDIKVSKYEDGVIVFDADDMTIFSREMEGLEEYPVDALKEFYESEMPASCKLPKNDLLQALDRISLFVGLYDENAVKLTFNGKSLEISSLAMTGVESIPYVSGDNAEFECSSDLVALIKHIKTQSTDNVEIQFGSAKAIKFVDGDTVQIVSLF